MDLDLKGRTALITGGSRGIGRAIGHALAAQGVNVAFCGRTPETLESTAGELREYGVGVWPFQADVSRLEEIQRFVGEARESAGGRIDILINNAVTSLSAPFDEQSDDHWRYHIDVKLMAYIRCAREVLPAMRERRWGRIVNVGGMTARITAPLRVTNGIVNAGVANFTKQLSGQVGGDNVTVNCVHPGTTATDRMMKMFERRARDAGVKVGDINEQTVAAIPLGRLIKPEDIAAAALFFCSPMAEMITGQSIAVDGGASDAVIY